jgi:ferredoxin-NADP reductase
MLPARRASLAASAVRALRRRSAHSSSAVPTSVATIEQTRWLSPSTRQLRMRLESSTFAFEPGQWVDLCIPHTDLVGGYSMTSIPTELPLLDLAIKASAHPPAAWCTRQARVGDRVLLRVGGTFVLRESEAALFVAGGVGINPLFSMLRALCARPTNAKAALLYTARTRDELLFASELHALARAYPERLRVCLHATREEPPLPHVEAAAAVIGTASGRVDEDALESMLRFLGCEPLPVRAGAGVPWRPQSRARERGTAHCAVPATGAYVCGPPAFTDETVAALRRMGVAHAYTEKWW